MATPATQRAPSTSARLRGAITFPSSTAYEQTEREPLSTVRVYALSAGHFSLPQEQFHKCLATGKLTRIVFDLGLRRDVKRYPEPLQRHLATREPYSTDQHVVKSLADGGLTPKDIDYVIYSHVHWDHVGEPRDFPTSFFVVGHGSLNLLRGVSTGMRGGHSHFEPDLLEPLRTLELSDPKLRASGHEPRMDGVPPSSLGKHFSEPWKPIGILPSTLDVFGDGSLYVVDAPGHLPGHINLLARTDGSAGHADTTTSWLYLAGDACHDRCILRKEKSIGEWHDAHGQVCCIHADRPQAEETIERVRQLESQGVEVILSHDVEWESNAQNRSRFFGVSP
ncbi:Beta-lactamase-like protein [Niveomyces insectorum RCEF 264]|uniref:Beta-lactamase-like protein n=1 Tax=Niveomyces insectorum RCEF 264 TaxID=1081102 RepID=A0A167MNC0_9HYPO|nr:Beta-lactamase-like protein [Niveomyces insectorum RCEF 264]